MLDSFNKVNLGKQADAALSLYEADGEHYLVRHFPFGFARLPSDYARTLIDLYGGRDGKNDANPEIARQLKEFIEARSEHKVERNLRRLNLVVAQKCNSRCTYCYAGDGDYGEDRLMSLDIARTAIEGALSKFDKIKCIQFFGGEPLLASQLIEQAIAYAEQAAARLGKPTPIFTAISNLTILPENIFKLVQAGKLNIVTSLDGPAQFHNQNRRLASGRPTYEAVVRNIQKLTPFSQPRAIEATYTAYHKKNGITPREVKEHVQSICPHANVVVVPELNLPFEAGETFAHSELLSYCAGDPGWSREKLQKVLSRYTTLISVGGSKDIFCDLGVGNFSVDTRGRVWPCHILCNKGEPLGTIADDWDVIANRYESGMGKDLKKSNFSECGKCFLKDYCTACPMAWQRNNGRMAPNPSQCETDRRAYLTAFRLSLDTDKAAAAR